MTDLQDILSRLKASGPGTPSVPTRNPGMGDKSSLWAQPPAYQAPSVSSPIFSPPIATPNPTHPSDILSPAQAASSAATPLPDQDRTNILLNLLKSNQAVGKQAQSSAGALATLQNVGISRSSSSHVPSILTRENTSSRPLSASDLVASLQAHTFRASSAANNIDNLATDANNSQDILANVFKSKTQPVVIDDTLREALAPVQVHSGSTPIREFGNPAVSETVFEAPQPTKATKFNYKNPFDELHSSSPLKSSSPVPRSKAETPVKFEILKHSRETSTTGERTVTPAMKSRKLDTEFDETRLPLATASDSKSENKSVSETLESVSKTVHKQAEMALAQAEARSTTEDGTTNGIHQAGAQKTRISKDPVEDVASSWESADDEGAEFKVEVYNFPMKPFVSIQIESMPTARPIRQDHFMIIAQLRKDFDQIDRCLCTASESHIVYAQVASKRETGGFRIIRQDNGDHKHVFRATSERIFNVQLCTTVTTGDDVETVLGTGVNGSVLWTSLSKSSGDLFVDDDIEAQGFIMPPVATAEENTSGSPIKTRARMSSRHPEFFAVARGKQIFMVSPDTAKGSDYCDQNTRIVDTEKYLKDHTLKISTGKAGKDFCFSEDDTVIVSLDKVGRFKFWDIRELTARASDIEETKHEPLELHEPLWTMNAAASGSRPDEKPSVSSIMFLDKEKPTVKGHALRYMIIGFKQNHILQLWDLGLGKAVQEIRLPHEKDSDGICSISYHAKSGIVAVGHPTRNSVYFIHLSAPKYIGAHTGRDQAEYIRMLARNDPTIPKPDSTAIMSGLREFSLAEVGQLRSIEMLKTPIDNASKAGTMDETLFELYIMHAKGIVGVSIKRDDLGWDSASKMVAPKDAQAEGVIKISDLTQPHKVPILAEQSGPADSAPKQGSKSAKKEEPLKHQEPPRNVVVPFKIQSKKDLPAAVTTTDSPKAAEPVLKAPASIGFASKPLADNSNGPTAIAPDTASSIANTQSATALAKDMAAPTPADVSRGPSAAQPLPTTPSISVAEMQSLISKNFEALYERQENERRARDAEFNAKQDALLRLVSSTLTDNVERSLTSIVNQSIQTDVLPKLDGIVSNALHRDMVEILPQHLSTGLKRGLDADLLNVVRQALLDQEVQRHFADANGSQIALEVQQQIRTDLGILRTTVDTLSQSVANLTNSMNLLSRQVDGQTAKQMEDFHGLTSVQKTIQTTLHELFNQQRNVTESLATTQNALAQLQYGNGPAAQAQTSHATMETAGERADPAEQYELDAQEQYQLNAEVDKLTKMLISGDWHGATMSWISSTFQAELFDKLFIRVNMDYLDQLEPLVMLTVSVAITSSLTTHVDERLEWLGRIIDSIDVRHPDVHPVAPKIMDVLLQRLEGARLAVSENNPRPTGTLSYMDKISAQITEVRRLTA